MGGGIGSIDSALREMLDRANDEIALTVYSLSTSRDRIFDLLHKALARGVRVTMIVNRTASQPRAVIHSLQRLARQFPHFHLREYRSVHPQSDLHAKAVVVDRKVALVGSSNLSSRGWIFNHELAVVVRGSSAKGVARAIDRLLNDPVCVRLAN